LDISDDRIQSPNRRFLTMIGLFGNATVLPAEGWHSEPTYRGTFSILSSCLITMSLCVWTAVHLNLPDHREEPLWFRKTLWLFLGLLAPEVVVWSAWRQRSKMTKLSRMMRDSGFMAEKKKKKKKRERIPAWLRTRLADIQTLLLLRAESEPELGEGKRQELPYNRIHAWTDIHSWYAVMGGFAFEDTAAEELQFMHGNRRRMTLTDDAVLWLATNRSGLLPDISKGHIQDKSKSGGLAKFLTGWQAIYFCTQCAFRLSRHYSISLLELNVFAHALCALLLFWIWFDKPQDVQEPTLITDQEGLDLCAYFSLKPEDREIYIRDSSLRTLTHAMRPRWVACKPSSDAWEVSTPRAVSLSMSDAVTSDASLTTIHLLFGPRRQPCMNILDTFWTIEVDTRPDKVYGTEGLEAIKGGEKICKLNDRSMHRLQRAYEHARHDETFAGCPVVADRCADLDWERLQLFQGISRTIDPRELFSSRSRHLFKTAGGLTLAGVCYGGLHLTAWSSQFPSHAQTMLWRAASVTILATGPFSVAYVLCVCTIGTGLRALKHRRATRHPDRIDADTENLDETSVGSPQQLVTAGVSFALDDAEWLELVDGLIMNYVLLWYAICRAFIVVECFIMLAHLPDTTLAVPQWAAYIPHIT
jgi:hypothetical protein